MLCINCGNKVENSKRKFCSSYACEKEYTNKIREEYIRNSNKLGAIIQPLPVFDSRYDINFKDLKQHIKDKEIELNPDFQRGNVWTREQQISFIEAIMKGKIHEALLTVIINRMYEDENPDFHGIMVIDGLQRLTAIMQFVDEEFKVFNNQIGIKDVACSQFNILSKHIKFQVMKFKTRKDVIQYYIDFNTGGTVHSIDEIERVKLLLKNQE